MMQEKRLLIFFDLRGQRVIQISDQPLGLSTMQIEVDDLTKNYSICVIGLTARGSRAEDPYIQNWVKTIQFPFILIEDINELETILSKVDALFFSGEIAPDIQKTIIAMAGYHSVAMITSNSQH